MNILNRFLDFLNQDMKEPVAFSNLENSWFYYLSLVLVVIGIIFLTRYFKKIDHKQLKKTIFLIGLSLIAFEIYKQIIFTYDNHGDYRWYAFPFQFCSTAMYATFVYGISKNKTLDDVLISFLATYAFFAGVAVMFYPTDVFTSAIGINIQTMYYHGSMVVMGAALIFSKKVSLSSETLFKGLLPMTVFWMMAVLMNGFVNHYYAEIGTFNMFLINPRYNSSIPVLNLIEPHVSAPVFQVAYLLGITFASYVTFKLFVGLSYIPSLFRPKQTVTKQDVSA